MNQIIFRIIFSGLFLCSFVKLNAQELSAGIYERFLTPSFYSFGSDGAARLQRNIHDRGIRRVTANLRLAYSLDHESFYFSRPRSSRLAIEDMLTMGTHFEAKTVLRPIVVLDAQAEVAIKSSQSIPVPRDISKFVTSLKRQLGFYASILQKYEVDELVFPSGLDFLYEAKNLEYLNDIALHIRRLSQDARFALSLELNMSNLYQLEASKKLLGAEKFNTLLSDFSRVRILGIESLVFDSDDRFLQAYISRLDQVLPQRELAMSEIVFSNCENISLENYLDNCDNQPHMNAEAQSLMLDRFLTNVNKIYDSAPHRWSYFEIRYGMTDVEPSLWQPYATFIMWNQMAMRVLEKFVLRAGLRSHLN